MSVQATSGKPGRRPPRCNRGHAIPPGAVEGLCPECLLEFTAYKEPITRKADRDWKTIPVSLSADGARRMSWLGLALAVSAAGVYVTGYYVQPGWISPTRAPASYTVGVAGMVATGLTLFLLPRVRFVSTALALDAGFVIQAIAALFISLSENSYPYTEMEPVRANSSVGVWIAIFALAVPVRFGKGLIASLAAASMGPIGLGIQILLGNVPSPPAPLWFILCSGNYLLAIGASVLGRLIYRLGAEVKVAREYGGYQLISLIGSGGMGEVWKARHHLIGREAAVKLIRPEVFQSQSRDSLAALRRFEREANATASLHSPHTVSLYNYGLSEDGLLYYVMELLDGFDLETLVDRFGTVPAPRVIHILIQVCDSLIEAHETGLIHRDIKPGNILLCRLGASYDFVKVVDFGLAQPTGIDQRALTIQGIAGTLAFIAPEILKGEKADVRSDIYGVGCAAYWLLSAQRLFDGMTPALMVQAHLSENPRPPSARTENNVPRELEAIVMACLEKDPAQRPQSARELSAALQKRQSNHVWTRHDAAEWWRQLR